MKKNVKLLSHMLVLILLSFAAGPAAALAENHLADVSVVTPAVKLDKGRIGTIAWQTRTGGNLDLLICNLDGYVVRHLLNRAPVHSGDHAMGWDGCDDRGVPVCDGAYLPFIRLTTDRRSVHVYSPCAGRWGGRATVEDLRYDAQQQQITYRLEEPALCLLRIGLANGGPCYGTLLHWAPRPAGSHTQPWDGKDIQGIADIFNQRGFTFIFDAITLPRNTFLVSGSPTPATEPDPKAERLAVHPPTGKDVFIHSLHPRHICRDPWLLVEVSNDQSPAATLPVVGRSITFTVTAGDSRIAANMQREGCEIYAFLDGVFQYEVKTAQLPAAIAVPTHTLTPGEHVITLNLRSIEDHVGAYSMRVLKK